MIRRSARRRARGGDEEMNITAFMNLMVILVPFLLITAVFSRLTILQLNLPGDADPQQVDTELVHNWEIMVRKGGIDVADRATGLLRAFPVTPTGYDLVALNAFLKELKARYPEKTDATVLLEPDASYDTVIQVMDAVRSFTVEQDGKFMQAELFPAISVGDAPVIEEATS